MSLYLCDMVSSSPVAPGKGLRAADFTKSLYLGQQELLTQAPGPASLTD